MQQASAVSGIESSYDPYLENLVAYVERYKQNRSAKLAWHMTWAYQQDYDHVKFDSYGRDQQRMYSAIVSVVQNKIASTGKFSIIIPSGTAIQNVRSSFIGDNLTRDGFHLEKKLGRYVAGLSCFCALTGDRIDNITYRPDVEKIPLSYLPMIKYAVQRGIYTPYQVADMSDFAPV